MANHSLDRGSYISASFRGSNLITVLFPLAKDLLDKCKPSLSLATSFHDNGDLRHFQYDSRRRYHEA